MRKRPYLIAALAVAFVSFIALVRTNADSQLEVQSKASRAQRLWETSAHADKEAEAFVHWDEEGSIPTSCAKCHSTPGFRDYLGADGSAVNVVDKAASLGTTVECAACHADPEKGITHARTEVIFPSGVEASGLGPEAMCMECHQGRASTTTVDDAIAAAELSSDDTVSSKLRFTNIHYYAAAASQFGTAAKGGYQYAGKAYDARFAHIPGYNACYICHNPHSLEVKLEACRTCHTGVNNPKDIRFYGSFVDYDGDGNISEGIYYEIDTLKGYLYGAMRAYARQIAGTPIAYDEHAYPYFFIDANDNGIVDSDEAASANGYKSFTARLLRAAYNFQVAMKDTNSFAHGGKYIIELLYDSIEDLNNQISANGLSPLLARPPAGQVRRDGRKSWPEEKRMNTLRQSSRFLTEDPSDITDELGLGLSGPGGGAKLIRTDEGHFDGSSEAWRHWDAEGAVPATCAKCHSAEGLPYFLEHGKNDISLPTANGMLCVTCHTSPPLLRPAGPVNFPSGSIRDLSDASNLCLNCHQGRAAKKTVDTAIAGGPGPYSFTNIHYYPAAASFFGSEVQGGYEFPGKMYNGRNIYTNHNGIFTDCVECHFGSKSFNRKQDASDDLFHNAEPTKADCVLCHGADIAQAHPGSDPDKFEFEGIRPAQTPDYDADGNTGESLQDEIKGLEDALFARLQAYGNAIGSPVVYDDQAYPYFFKDSNGNGAADPEELTSANGYRFTAPMLRAAYNFQFSKKEPCGYIHNPLYIAQLLLDSVEHLGGDVTAYTWR